MRARPAEIRALAANAMVVATYWLNFLAIGTRREIETQALGSGVYHVMALFAPYLTGEARRHFDKLSRRYID